MSEARQHATLSPQRWAGFPFPKQVLMVANEMNRAAKLMGPADRDRLLNAYERVLSLTDLTISLAPRRAVRRELLRWRDLVAALYVGPVSDPQAHADAFRALLMLTPEAKLQMPYVLG